MVCRPKGGRGERGGASPGHGGPAGGVRLGRSRGGVHRGPEGRHRADCRREGHPGGGAEGGGGRGGKPAGAQEPIRRGKPIDEMRCVVKPARNCQCICRMSYPNRHKHHFWHESIELSKSKKVYL
eukprot:scaffold135952_cov45-Prasinocladus_malaysianus.AAC.1